MIDKVNRLKSIKELKIILVGDSNLMYMFELVYAYDKGWYSRDVFNEYGDVVYKSEREQMDVDVYFAKTRYHLTNEGAEVRTNQLIFDLKGWTNCQ